MTEPAKNIETILAVIEQAGGSADRFAETLRHRQIPHISFSQVTTVEFCHQRYFLEYVRLLDLTPVPDYFTKGKLLHQVLASYYETAPQNPAAAAEEGFQTIDRACQEDGHGDNHGESHGDNLRHLRNAFTVHLENQWRDCQILAIEKPFAMVIGPELPPLVGVIDLIAEKDGSIIIVDHKTGRDFAPQDELQMAVYVQYIRQQYGDVPCAFYYDNYRWVNNLSRIRKPAFQRTQVSFSAGRWPAALARIRAGFETMEQIRSKKRAAKNGECFRCPYRKVCF